MYLLILTVEIQDFYLPDSHH